MSEPIVLAEHIGKRYQIDHARGRQPYVALRDVITQAVSSPRAWWRQRGAGQREDFWALRDVSFGIAPGEVVGVIGRNGAGKSTLLKLLSRISEPTTGRLTLGGRVASLLEVGTGFHPELTGRENIFLNGAILGMSRAEIARKFDEIVAFAEVEQFLDTPVKRYSSGMYVRLAFAVAAHLEPDILIVDEVLSVGDAEFQRRSLGKMHDVSRSGRTVLFVSHSMSAVQTLCRRAIWLDHGQVTFDGAVEECITKYLSSAAAAGVEPSGSVSFGPALELRSFKVTPNPAESGAAIDFSLTLHAVSPTRLEQLTVLIYSWQETRLAIVDLRRAGLPRNFAAGESWTASGRITRLPLVEGDYRVGLGVADTFTLLNKPDLIDLRVAPRPDDSGIVPYAAAYRGVLELEFAVAAS
jgi:lipopolysaccharide transport system ATP-binding protein